MWVHSFFLRFLSIYCDFFRFLGIYSCFLHFLWFIRKFTLHFHYFLRFLRFIHDFLWIKNYDLWFLQFFYTCDLFMFFWLHFMIYSWFSSNLSLDLRFVQFVLDLWFAISLIVLCMLLRIFFDYFCDFSCFDCSLLQFWIFVLWFIHDFLLLLLFFSSILRICDFCDCSLLRFCVCSVLLTLFFDFIHNHFCDFSCFDCSLLQCWGFVLWYTNFFSIYCR